MAKNADILIHECSWYKKRKSSWGHVYPELVAKLAKKSMVKKLIPTHFNAYEYFSMDLRKIGLKRAQKIFPETIMAYDDLVLDL